MGGDISQSFIMWTAAQIAERDGVSKQAVSKSIKSIIATNPDVPAEHDARGRITKISLPHYDHHRERFMNPAKMAKPVPKEAELDSFEEARRQIEWIKVQREKIRIDEEVSNLIRADKHNEAIRLVEREIRLVVDRFPNKAEELAAAVSKEGVHGVRVSLRQIAFEMSNEIADRLEQIGQEASETDPLIDENFDFNRPQKVSNP
jgi:hypothetical protein